MLARSITLALLLLSSITSLTTHATDIVIYGQVTYRTCQVIPETKTQTIDFGQLRNQDLAAAGSSSEWKYFYFSVFGCNVPVITATFNGTPATINPDLYANAGSAKNVEIEIQGTGGENLGDGKSYTYHPSPQSNVSWNLQTRLHSTSGKATEGTIAGVVQITLTYS